MVRRSVDELLPAVLAEAARAASERSGSPPPDQIRRRGDARHRQRVAGTLAAVAVLAGAATVVALDGRGQADEQPIGPLPSVTRTARTTPATQSLPPGTKLRVTSAMLLPANAVPRTPANRPWVVIPVQADGDTNCRAPNDNAVVRGLRTVSQKYLVDVPGAGNQLDSASEALYETSGDQAARSGYTRLVNEANLCPGTPARVPGPEIRGNGGAGRVWLLGSGPSQAYAGVGYKANVVVVIDRLVYPRSGIQPAAAADTERMLLNAFARIR